MIHAILKSVALGGASGVDRAYSPDAQGSTFESGSTYSVLHIVAYSLIFKDFVSHIKCATYCVLHFLPAAQRLSLIQATTDIAEKTVSALMSATTVVSATAVVACSTKNV